MGKQNVNGTVTLGKNGYSSYVHLWELFDLRNGQQAKRKWTIWTQALPTDIKEGDWIEVEGEFGISVSKDMDGKPMTYTDKDGNEITKHDLSLNDVNILQVKMKDNSGAEGRDLDDVRKYDTAQNRDLMEQPF